MLPHWRDFVSVLDYLSPSAGQIMRGTLPTGNWGSILGICGFFSVDFKEILSIYRLVVILCSSVN